MLFNIPAEFKHASGVYIIRNSVNSKVYVGSARDLRKRYLGHRSHLRRGKHASRYMQRHCDKYGVDSFSFNLLALVADDVNELLKAETEQIEVFDAANPKRGFNSMPASFPARHSEGTKAKLKQLLADYITPEIIARRSASIRATGAKRREARLAIRVACLNCQTEFCPRALGVRQPKFCSRGCARKHPISEEARARLSASSTGRRHTPEAIEKIRNAQKGRPDLRSVEGKERARQAVTGRTKSPEERAKAIAVLNRPDVRAKQIAAAKMQGHATKSPESERQRTCQQCRKGFLADWPK